MNIKAMNMFLSENNIKRHLEHLRTQRLRLSILEKSLPQLKGVTISELQKMNIKREIKNEATDLMWYIKSHECFFNSFTVEPGKGFPIERGGISKEKFIYELFTEAMRCDHGFLYIYTEGQHTVKTRFCSRFDGTFVKYHPRLAIDLYEHTYLSDYGFKKDKFLYSALAQLDLSKLS